MIRRISTLVIMAACLGLVSTANAGTDVVTGPIWCSNDAKKKCPKVCKDKGLVWNGGWSTLVSGKKSVCGCDKPKPSPAKKQPSKPPAAKKASKIVIYGMATCDLTKAMKKNLASKGIAYTYRDVDNDAAAQEMFTKAEAAKPRIIDIDLPVVEINGKVFICPTPQQVLSAHQGIERAVHQSHPFPDRTVCDALVHNDFVLDLTCGRIDYFARAKVG